MSVSVSGPVLSALLHEHSDAKTDQEGLLIGQVVNHVTDVISDSQLNNKKEEIKIYIYDFIPCSRPFVWYGHTGQIKDKEFKALLHNHDETEVIGWFRWRQQSSLVPSMREKAIHKSLLAALPGVDARHFLFALFSLSQSSHGALHSYQHKFHTYDGTSFPGVPLSIVNLKDTSQADYKIQASRTMHPRQGTYAKTLQGFRPEFMDGHTDKLRQVQSIHSLNSQLNQQLTGLFEEVNQGEEDLGRLMAEVETLRDRWKRKRYPPKPSPDHTRLGAPGTKVSHSPKASTSSHAPPTASHAPPTASHTTIVSQLSSSLPHAPPSTTQTSQYASHTAHVPPTTTSSSQSASSIPHAPPTLVHQGSNQELIEEELRDLFIAPPVINDSELMATPVVKPGHEEKADSLSDDSERKSTSLDQKSASLDRNSVPPSGGGDEEDDKMEVEQLEASPVIARKTRNTRIKPESKTKPDATLNNVNPATDAKPPKKKDAFDFVENMLMESVKNTPGKKRINQSQDKKKLNEHGAKGQGQKKVNEGQGRATRQGNMKKPLKAELLKSKMAAAVPDFDSSLESDDIQSSPTF